MQTKIVTIESLAVSGHGIADNGWYILGSFPGDVIKAAQYKFAEGISYGEILEIITPSKHRTHIPTESPFFDANTPWEFLDVDYENTAKKNIIHALFNTKNNIEIHSEIVTPGTVTTHYRNKAAYSFMYVKNNALSFALYTRGVTGKEKVSQTENILVHPMINKIGKQFLQFFNQRKVPLSSIKYLTLRYSYHTNTVVAHILVPETNRKQLPWKKTELATFKKQHPEIQGIIVSHSPLNIRSAQTTKDFYAIGNIKIVEEMGEKKYNYYPSQFFQIYPEAFSKILDDCHTIIEKIPHHQNYELLDLFAGVGVIGIHLADTVRHVHGVEQSPLARKFALQNATQNNIDNFNFTEANVDEVLEHIQENQILVVDPPRSGLGNKTLEKITNVLPEYIIYISCNPETQSENFEYLQSHYDITWSQGYNLFPKTPHIEHVLFLTKKAK